MQGMKKLALLGMILFGGIVAAAETHIRDKENNPVNRKIRKEIIIPEQRYVFDTDEENDNEEMTDLKNMLEKPKARFTMQGCRQKKGTHYEKTYALVAFTSSLRLILKLGVDLDYCLDVTDLN